MKIRVSLLTALLTAGCARTPIAVRPEPAPAAAPAPAETPARPRAAPDDSGVRPYADVIPASAVTREGLFRTHRVGGKLFYEIPRAALGKEMLLVTQVARNAPGEGAGGQAVGSRVLRWDRRDNRILLRSVSHGITADSALPIYDAVQAASYSPVVAAFPIETFGSDSAAVIEVTRLFAASPPEFGLGGQIRGGLDRERSFIERVAAFPGNIEVEATHTYTLTGERRPEGADPPQAPMRSASVLMHWSMVLLPEVPMRPRLHDERVGYFSVQRLDYGTGEHRAARRRFVTRWRLECPPGRSLPCEPVKPIVYYIDPATPAQWRPWIRRGVEDWQKALEEAGFRNAIVARDAPSPEQDPDWSPEDARFSVVRWLPSTVENAQGPHVHDPRTGEILEADIRVYHNVLNLLRNWYFVQAGPLDPRARTLPLPDSLMGRLLQYIVAHEVGHTLGLPHNQKASATYPADSLRSASFLRRMGHTPTLMDYSRFNYVAQPEDRIPPELLIPDIGPYDRFAIRWGYRPIPDAATPEDERATLNQWILAQDANPHLRFMTTGTQGADPGDQGEAVGDSDPVRSTRLGLRNLQRLVPMLIPATVRAGESYSELREVYDRVVEQWATELSHVVNVVGGVDSQEKYGGQDGVKYHPIAEARQREALRFLNEAAFHTPEFLLEPEILRRLEVEGAMDRVLRAQRRILASLLADSRMDRLVEFEALARGREKPYTLGDMLEELRSGVWSELHAGNVAIDPFRRNLQRAYLEAVDGKLNRRSAPSGASFPTTTPGDARALLRGELRTLDADLQAAIPRAGDRITRLHLEDARAQIERILEPR